jgi:hypothetical protein
MLRHILIGVVGFDWDEGNLAKCVMHGVDTAAIESLFRQPDVFVAADLEHSEQEDRFFGAGVDASGRPMVVVFTLRQRGGQRLIRPISARYMHAREARRYEQERAELQKRRGG